jgi:Tol biopolymer transport system component
MSADGRVVAFESSALYLAPGGFDEDVYVRDHVTRETRLVTTAQEGTFSQGYLASGACVSADGRFVVLHSGVMNAPPGPIDDTLQVYLADIQAGSLTAVSVNPLGEPGNDDSSTATISANGRFVAYTSLASDLVAGDTNDSADVFVFDRESGVTHRASVASDGTEGGEGSGLGVVSDDGAVAFASQAGNLVEGDSNGQTDVFLRALFGGETRRLSVRAGGGEATEWSSLPSISRDGVTVVFTSADDGLVSGDFNGHSDVFAIDVPTGEIRLLSADAAGTPGNGPSANGAGSLSVDGGWCAFSSMASNLVRRDRNGGETYDVFRVRVR